MNFLARLTLVLLVTSTIGHTASIYNFGLLERVGMAIGRRMIDFVDHREWADSIKSDNGQYSLDFINKTHERFLNEELLNSSLITGLFIDCVDPIEDADRLTNPLVAALRNPSVTTVGLWNVQFTDESATAVAEALRHNTTLTELSFLTCKNIGPIGEAIGDLLINTSLTRLYLAFTPIDSPAALGIAGSLKTNTTLNSLCLFRNWLKEEEADAIVKSIETNTILTEVCFGSNNIGGHGLVSLVDFLANNPNLRKYHIMYNIICFPCLKEICEILKINKSLLELDIRCHSFDDEEGDFILRSIQDHNTTLQYLGIEEENNINPNTIKAIHAAIERNRGKQPYKAWDLFKSFNVLIKSRVKRGRGIIPPPLL
ncbi:MAG: hypothetical protein NTX76_03620 [Alphaproteobacteria bacterium]|nr:hypothetical protein [Alphaproteobacteria bacterium]